MAQRHKKTEFIAVDLFAGGGGLSVGLKRAGFKIVAAVELEPNAFSTYKANHPEVSAFKQDIRTIKGKSILNLSDGHVDLLSGCPPCQGFSTLTTKYRRKDSRNELINEIGRLVEEIRPLSVMMENVPGLAKKGKPLFDDFLNLLLKLGYIVNHRVVQIADYGVPQNRKRIVLLAGKGFPIDIPSSTHARNPSKNLKPWRTVRTVLSGMPKPITLKESNKKGGPQSFNWHIVRNLSPISKERLRVTNPGQSRSVLPKHLRPKCHQNIDKGFVNVYGRMSWDQISPTITGGCTTLSKGRFGHPEENRTISVREAALLQTFPADYIIDTAFIDHACNIVGNALPCDFAEIFSRQCAKTIQAVKEKRTDN